jgi:hypothetical protein
LKQALMSKLEVKVVSRARRKEGSRDLSGPPNSTWSSPETFFPFAAVALDLVRGRRNGGWEWTPGPQENKG